MIKLTDSILKSVIQPRPINSYKGTFGKVLIIAGDANFGGAGIMATMAAVYTGSGLVTIATSKNNFTSIHTNIPEAMAIDIQDIPSVINLAESVNVIAIGPGLDLSEHNLNIINQLITTLDHNQTLILDASAITLIGKNNINLNRLKSNLVMTPHLIEWQRISGLKPAEQSTINNQTKLKQLASQNTELILKGAPSHIYSNYDAKVFENNAGSPAMATGGMGDTLTGIMAGFIAQFDFNQQTVLAATYLHSYIAKTLAKNNYVVLPTMLIKTLPKIMCEYSKK